MLQQIPLLFETNENTIPNIVNKENFISFSDSNKISIIDFTQYSLEYNNQKMIVLGPHNNKELLLNKTNMISEINTIDDDFCATISFHLDTSHHNSSFVQTFTYDKPDTSHIVATATITSWSYSMPSSGADIELLSYRSFCNTDNWCFKLFYNEFTRYWTLSYIDDTMTAVTSSFYSPIYPTYNNTITINCNKLLIHGNNRKMHNITIYHNELNIFNFSSYTEKSYDSFVIDFNPQEQFISYISYFDIRKYIDDIDSYSKNIHNIHSNYYWTKHSEQMLNKKRSIGTEKFNFYKTLELQHLISIDESIILPITLKGNLYNIPIINNEEITRSAFDFSYIDTLNPNFLFTYAGSDEPLDWIITTPYNSTYDMLTIWVKIPQWNGQKIHMYYGTTEIKNNPKNPFEDFFGCWHMNTYAKNKTLRVNNEKLFDVGEEAISYNINDKLYAFEIQSPYLFGKQNIYKSNMIDIMYDDREVNDKNIKYINEFISNSVKNFIPSFIDIRRIQSLYNSLYEASEGDVE